MMETVLFQTIFQDCKTCGWPPTVGGEALMVGVKCKNCGASTAVVSNEPLRDAAKLWNAGRYGYYTDPFPDDPPSLASQALSGGRKE